MLDIVICEGNPDHIAEMNSRVRSFFGEREHTVLCFRYPMDLFDYLECVNGMVDIAFVNTTYESEDGLATARTLRSKYPSVRLVVTSESSERIEEIFDLRADGFVWLPLRADSFEKRLSRLSNEIGKNISCLALRSRNGISSIPVSTIDYCMSDKRKVLICCAETEQEFYYKLDEIENMLSFGFMRCHQSYLVNMDKILQFVENGIILRSGNFVPVSQKRYYQSKKEYLRYITGKNDVAMI